MTEDSSPETKKNSSGRPAISLKFAAIISLVAFAAYFGTAPLITYVMYLQEKSKTNAPAEVRTAPSERPSFESLK